MDREKACKGGRTINTKSFCCQDMEECLHCGKAVTCGLEDHSFFGFQNCDQRNEYTSTDENKS